VNAMGKHVAGSSLTIGRPIPNNTVYILDDEDHPVGIGKKGIMWAGGKCVTRGYLKLPRETATRYKPDVFANDG
jgi:non-ribosomal peptide synthetase component F